MSLSDRLRKLIDERDITQKQLAKELNIAASTLGGYVQGYSEPDFDTLKLLATYFDVSMDYLLDFQRDKKDTSQQDELLRIFQSLSEEQRELYLEQGRAFLKINRRVKSSESISGKAGNAG